MHDEVSGEVQNMTVTLRKILKGSQVTSNVEGHSKSIYLQEASAAEKGTIETWQGHLAFQSRMI